MWENRKKVLLWIVIITTVFVVFVIALHFLVRNTRISNELNQKLLGGGRLETSLANVRIIEYNKRPSRMYIKLEPTTVEYERLKQQFLQSSATTSNKDFTADISSEESNYFYDPERYIYDSSIMDSIKNNWAYTSMNLDYCDELLLSSSLRPKESLYSGTTGFVYYALAKESNGDCYLYIIA